MLDLDHARLTDPGKAREHNEDYGGYSQPATVEDGRSHGWLFALADGLGGHEGGEVASRAAIDRVFAGFQAAPADEPMTPLLTRLFRDANAHIYELAKGSGMATTLVGCLFRYDRVAVAHVGDSRCYRIRDGAATLLTRDHAAARNKLTRSVGREMFVNVDVTEMHIVPGDIFALCSDGLHGAIDDAEIAAVACRFPRLDKAARELVDLANRRDGSDNISVQLIRVRSVERVGMYRGRVYKVR